MRLRSGSASSTTSSASSHARVGKNRCPVLACGHRRRGAARVRRAQRSCRCDAVSGHTTDRISGIESPTLLEPDATDYFAAAWRTRSFVGARAGGDIPRDWMSLAVNSALARAQNQLHIHVDCVRADVREALSRRIADVGSDWAPFPEPLRGRPYLAMAVEGENLAGTNPVQLLAEHVSAARDDMGRETLVVVGVSQRRPAGLRPAGRSRRSGDGRSRRRRGTAGSYDVPAARRGARQLARHRLELRLASERAQVTGTASRGPGTEFNDELQVLRRRLFVRLDHRRRSGTCLHRVQ
jgi:hypothetical protein